MSIGRDGPCVGGSGSGSGKRTPVVCVSQVDVLAVEGHGDEGE